MNASEQRGRKPRSDVQRNRTALLESAQSHFLRHGVSASLEAVAREAGVGPGTLYRHFPTRDGLLAALLQTRSEELAARQAACERLEDPGEALDQWLQAMEEYLGAFSGLPDPLLNAAQARDPDNPLTIPCSILIATTEQFLLAAQSGGHVRRSVRGFDLFLSACSIAWIRSNGAEEEALNRLRLLFASGYRERVEKA